MGDAELLAALFRPLGIDGVYARTAAYAHVQDALDAYIGRLREPGVEILRLPAVMSRAQLEKSGYLKSFPHLLGCLCTLDGSEAFIRAAVDDEVPGSAWTNSLRPADMVLTPAACYPVYPMVAQRGVLPEGGLQFDIQADCFRHEPSQHLDRLQSFRMREFVRIGSADDASAFRERWLARAPIIALELELPHTIDLANDPFFGRIGQVMAVSQRQQALKFEFLVPIRSGAAPTACMSFNLHRHHFGAVWDITQADGTLAHTSCVAFGVDRLTIALFAVHGLDIAAWPAATRDTLRL